MNYQLLFSSHHLWDTIVLFPFFFNFPPFTGYDTQIIHPSSLFVVSLFFKSFRILNCHAFDSAEMKIGQMKKVPLGLWREKLSKLQGILCESGIYFFSSSFCELFLRAPKRATNKSDLSSFSEGVRNTSRNSARKHFKNQIFFCYIVLSLSCLLRVYLRQTIVWQLCCSK